MLTRNGFAGMQRLQTRPHWSGDINIIDTWTADEET